MKRITLIAIAGLFLASCKKESTPVPDYTGVNLHFDSLKVLTSDIPFGQYTDLFFTNENTGYAITTGKVLKTTNGGKNWIPTVLPENVHLKKIQFTDDRTGYIIGGDNGVAYLFKTTNAGTNWRAIPLPSTEEPSDMFFISNQTGFITGRRLFIKTNNGGENLVGLSAPGVEDYHSVAFRNKKDGVVTADHGIFLRTSDYGTRWETVKQPVADNMYDIHFTNTGTWVATTQDSIMDIDNNYRLASKPANAAKMLYLSSSKVVGIGAHFEGGFYPNGDVLISNNGWTTYEQKTFPTAEAMAFTAIARMRQDKIMILGYGFSGTRVLTLTW